MKKFLSKLICGTLLVFGAVSANTASAHVLDGSIEYNDHCYKVFQQAMTWENAKEFCESMGGHLATAETPDENEFIKDLFINNYSENSCWIGASRDKRGIWKWVSGKMIGDYYDWAGGSEGSYYYMRLMRKYSGQWGTDTRSDKYVFMCEWDRPDYAHESNW